jgi:hypothetical protein
MTSRRVSPDELAALFRECFCELLAEWGMEVEVKVDVEYSIERMAFRARAKFTSKRYVIHKAIDWLFDEDHPVPAQREVFAAHVEQFAEDAFFSVELPEWQLLNLLSKGT